MKVCLYLELAGLLKKSGIGVALRRQMVALDKAGIEYTLNPIDDYDLIHINTVLPRSYLYAQRAKERGIKVILHAHTLEEDTVNSFTGSNFIGPFFKKYLQHYYGLADHIICPTPYVKKVLETEYGMKQPITAISNGVDLDKFKFSEKGRGEYRNNYHLEGIVPFSVGHVFMRKGVTTFLEVARSFEKNKFVWFGNYFKGGIASNKDLDKELETKPKNVLFTGYVDNIFSAYSAGDIFFFPSRAETQGIVILEAWAMGRPVLIRDLPVFSDWTTDGVDCLKANTDEEFKEKLKLLMDDGDLRDRLVKEGLKTAQQHSMDKIGAQLKKVYEDTLNGK